ncbi:MAG: phosphoribosylanthranilate isomerase [Myxococcota bacterium]
MLSLEPDIERSDGEANYMHISVKMCGFIEADSILHAVRAGVDSIGLVLDPSPRQISIAHAQSLMAVIPSHVQSVIVCGRPDLAELEEIRERLNPDLIQLMSDALPDPSHGFEVLPAFEDGPDIVERVDAYRRRIQQPTPVILADGPKPGSGVLADWDRIEVLGSTTRLVIAGGLTPDNVGAAIGRMRPYGVDVSSGIEVERGVKDPDLIDGFMAAVRDAEQRIN